MNDQEAILDSMPVPKAFLKLAVPAVAALDQAPKAIFLTVWRKIILLIPLIFCYMMLK